MNKKDIFIKEKLQQDKKISDKANKIFDNIKGEFKLENNEKKIIKISFNKFLAIAACLVIVGFVGINIYANSLGKPNIISGIQALIRKERKENTDEIAKELFEKGAEEIRRLQYSGLIKEEYEVEGDLIEKNINGRVYVKTNEKYEKAVQKYEKIFTDKALEDVLAERFANVDGVLYISYGGATGWGITNVEVEKTSEKDGEIAYRASYNDVSIEGFVDDKKQTCEFKIKKVNGEYRISETNYYNLGQELNVDPDDNNNNFDNEIAKELFEKGAEEIRKLYYSGLIKEEYEVSGNLIERRINGRVYVRTDEKYEKVVQKYGKIFTDKALENVLAERFANVDGVLYISYGGATGWGITNVEVEKTSEKDGEIAYRASYNDVSIEGFVDDKKQTCEFKIKKVNGEYKISETNYYNLGEYDKTTENISDSDIMIDKLKNRNTKYRANYYYRLASLKNNNDGTYTAIIEFYTPVIISETEYKNIASKGSGEINGVSYTFSNKSNEDNIGYGYIYKNNEKYTIEKQEAGYAFYSETGGVVKTIDMLDMSFEMILDKDFGIQQIPSGGSYTLKEYASKLTDKFISNNVITFEYSKQNGKLYMARDSR